MATSLTTDEQIKDLQTLRDRAKDAQKAAEKDANEAKLRLESLSAELVEAKSALSDAQSEVELHKASAVHSVSSLEDVQSQLERAESTARSALADLDEAKQNLAAAKAELSISEEENERLIEANEMLQKQADDLRAASVALNALKSALS